MTIHEFRVQRQREEAHKAAIERASYRRSSRHLQAGPPEWVLRAQANDLQIKENLR